MMSHKDVNSMWFDDSKKALELIEYLLKGDNTHYNEIRIKPEDTGVYVVEWTQVPWSGDYGGHFEYVDEDQVIMEEYLLPDNTYVLLSDDEEFKEYLDNWLKENPGWIKTPYGTWTNTIENEKFIKAFESECEECKVPESSESGNTEAN